MRWVAALTVSILLSGCFLLPRSWEARPADRMASVEELADELGADLCETFRRKPRVRVFQFGVCKPSGAETGSTDPILVAVFDERESYEKTLRADKTGCNGTMVFGPNWNVGPLKYGEIDLVLDVVGGRVVGESEKVDC